jgi:hypothetical protein
MLFLDGSKHTIAEIPHCSVVPFAVTVVFIVLPYPAGLWKDPFFRRIYFCRSHPNLELSMNRVWTAKIRIVFRYLLSSGPL